MIGLDRQEVRHGCDFGAFFAPDATHPPLLKAGIYSQIAIPLKGADYRKVSMALFAQARREPIPAACEPVGS